jgi:hypothetical protein
MAKSREALAVRGVSDDSLAVEPADGGFFPELIWVGLNVGG